MEENVIPYQISFLDFSESDAVKFAIQKRIERLEHFFDQVITCQVVVSCPHRKRSSDRLCQTQIRLFTKGESAIVNRDPQKNESHRNIYIAIRDSFDSLERILKDQTRIMRREVKHHEKMPAKFASMHRP